MQSIKKNPSQLDKEVIGFQMLSIVEVGGGGASLGPWRIEYPCHLTVDTEENVKAYIQAVVDFYLDQSTEEEFLAFKEGYKAVANCDWLWLVEPRDPRLTFCGLQGINWPLIKTMTNPLHII